MPRRRLAINSNLRKEEGQLKEPPRADEVKRLCQAESDLGTLRNAQLSDEGKAVEQARAEGE